MRWDPNLYLKFEAERTQPAIDLAARIEIAEPAHVIDLGCGPGNSTAVLRRRWPNAAIVGLDSDADMLAKAQRSDGDVRWILADAAALDPAEKFDVVYSNAMLQWLPDHAAAVPRLFEAVAVEGALAFQLPHRLDSKLHEHLMDTASDPSWREATAAARKAIVSHDPAFYYDLLCGRASRIDLWTTEYCHVLDGPEAIVTWIRSTRLRPFLAALSSEGDRARFEKLLLDRVAESYRRERDGRVLFPFRRLFCVAYRPAA
jgi:trans-aconitate 2-methyltransferase